MKKWMPLFLTQFFGVLNDNLLKYLIIFIGVLWVSEDMQSLVIPIASALLVLPYVLFSPFAGLLSQLKSKTSIVKIAKLAEIPIMALAIIGFSIENITLLLVSLFLMGLQSAIYSPSKLGLIKDVAGKSDLNRGTGIMDFLGFIAVLLSTVLAGYIANLSANQITIIGVILLLIAVAGWFTSTKISTPVLKDEAPNRISIMPLKFMKESFLKAKKIRGLNMVILGLGMFWFIASLIQMNLLVYCKEVLLLDSVGTSVIWAITTIGIALGCFTAGIINKSRVELGISVIGAIGLAVFTLIAAFADLGSYGFCAILFFGAFSAGLYKIPLNSWMQERSSSKELPSNLAYLNMVVFIIILISSGIFALFMSHLDSIAVFYLIGFASLILAIYILIKNPAEFVRIIVFIMARVIYKMNIKGVQNIPKDSGALIVANHLSFMDFILIAGSVPRKIRYVMFKDTYDHKLMKWFFKSLNMIPIAPRGRNNLQDFNKLCQDQINQGHVVVIFAEGMVSRNGHLHEFKRGMEHIANKITAPIIPIHMEGVLGTPFTYLAGNSKSEKFRFKNLRNKVFINIGEPMKPTSTSFEVRQKVMELNADNLAARIEENQLSHHDFIEYSFKNLRSHAFQTDRNPISHRQLIKRVFTRAKGIKTKLDGKSSAIIFIDDQLEHAITCLAMSLAGKTSILAKANGTDIDYLRRKFITNTVLTDKPIAKVDFSPVWISHLDDKKMSVPFIRMIRLFNSIDRYFNNKHDKYDKVIIGSSDDGNTATTHQNLIATIYGLGQVNNLAKYGNLKVFFGEETSIHNLLSAWLPACKPIIGATGDDLMKVNSVIGLEEDIHDNLPHLNSKSLQNIITDFNKFSILSDVIDANKINIQTGFGLLGNIPILSLNTKDFVGQDIAGKSLHQIGSNNESAGRPLPGLAVQIVDANNWNNVLMANEVGTILIRGAQIAQQLTLKTADYLNGWLNTKMTGYIDEKGFVHFV
ncbi:MAG: 1-acyl-sn-glycerol-3-phosphate acyltransferase [Parvicellaceae bacterium]|jgi:1-acyl-sn-glycerol-3-phosphate acyltransferase